MDALHDLKNVLEKEITKVVSKGEIAPTEVKVIGDVVDILKDIETICAMKDYADDDHSYAMPTRGYSTERYSRRNPEYYYDDYSNKRDSRGRYSRHTEKDEMIGKLEKMMRNASSEEERMDISECIEKLERM